MPPPEMTGMSDVEPATEAITEPVSPGDGEALFGVSFDDVFRAEEFLLALRGMASRGELKLNDAVVVYKTDDGTVRARETRDLQASGTAVSGAMWTGLIGLLIGGPIGFVAGLGIGAGAGAITAKVVDVGIPDEWVDWFKEAVRPHTSTVVALASDVDLTKLYQEAQRFAGAELVHTTLRPGASADLAAALQSHAPSTCPPPAGASVDNWQVTQAVAHLATAAFECCTSRGNGLIGRKRRNDLVEQIAHLVAELAVREDVRQVLADASHDSATDIDRVHRSLQRIEHRVRVAFP